MAEGDALDDATGEGRVGRAGKEDAWAQYVMQEGWVSRAGKWDASTQCAVWISSGGWRLLRGFRTGSIAGAQYIRDEEKEW